MASVAGQEAPALSVSPQVCLEGENVRITVRLDPDSENRLLTIEADSADFYRSSEIQLDGEQSPAVHTLMLHSLPSGRYIVRATVIQQDGDARSTPMELRVVGV